MAKEQGNHKSDMWMKTAVGLAVATGVAAGAAYMADRVTKGGLRKRATKLMENMPKFNREEYSHQLTTDKKRGRRSTRGTK